MAPLYANFLKNVTLFTEFEPDEMEALGKSIMQNIYAPADTILDEGNANRALHVLRRGRVRVTRGVNGADVALCDLGEGETFGELSIIEDGVASASLRAVTDVEVWSIPMQPLANFLREHPAAGKFWRAIAVDLRRRLIHTNDVVRSYFEINKALVDNPTFRQAYAMCNR
jgi:CRP/FNR family transcriptional regulator, cyclic AMP receptor protein